MRYYYGMRIRYTVSRRRPGLRKLILTMLSVVVLAQFGAIRLHQLQQRTEHLLKMRLHHQRQHLNRIIRQPNLANPYFMLGPWMQRLDDLRQRQESLKPTARIAFHKEHLKQLGIQLEIRWERIFKTKQAELQSLKRTLKAVNPKNLLAQGYSIIFDEKGDKVVKSVNQVIVGEKLKVMVSDGSFMTQPIEVLK